MAWKKYQPERTDFLINTDWGIPQENLSKKEAQESGKKLFQKRWITREEKKQLKEEYTAYSSIRSTGILLILGSGLLLINLFFLLKSPTSGKMIWAFLELVFAGVLLAAGVGLFRFAPWGRNIALPIFLSFLILPFTPLLGNDKGTPVLIICGLAGFYYLLRRPARRIFAPLAAGEIAPARPKKSVLLWIVYTILAWTTLVIYLPLICIRRKRWLLPCVRAPDRAAQWKISQPACRRTVIELLKRITVSSSFLERGWDVMPARFSMTGKKLREAKPVLTTEEESFDEKR